MKKTLALLLVMGLMIAGTSPASAFSTEQGSGQNSDGSPKFADPDEQMPNFIMGSNGSQQPGLQPLPLNENQVTLPTIGETDRGAAAFNQAYAHLQNH